MNVSMDDAYKALRIISEVCKQNELCKSCPFQSHVKCGIVTKGYPAYWSIKNPKIELFD
jgi:hypothetical protein